MPVGNPVIDLFIPNSSPVLIQHVYHLSQIEYLIKPLNSYDRIIEIGGGYGSFTRLISKTDYTGEYWVFDLEPMHVIQQFYLNKIPYNEKKSFNIERYSDISTMLGRASKNRAKTLLIATWSLSEMPLTLRDIIFMNQTLYDNVYITYQGEFGHINNHQYFTEKANGIYKCNKLETYHNDYVMYG